MNQNQKSPSHIALRLLKRAWLPLIVASFAALLLLVDSPGWAAPAPEMLNQTVPRPTPTPGNTPVPTATPGSGSGSGSSPDRDNEPGTVGGPGESGTLQAEVIAPQVNLYEQPDANSAVLGLLVEGDLVDLLARNESNTWWVVCCLPGSATRGWVPVPALDPNRDPALINRALPVMQSPTQPLPQATISIPADGAASGTEAADPVASDEPPGFGLELTLQQDPPYVWQGNRLELIFTVTNPSQSDAVAVEVRDQLAADLTFVDADLSDEGRIDRETAADGGMILVMKWDSLPAGTDAQAFVTLQVADNLINGAVIDNLAYADARNAFGQTAGLSIGMPPSALPDFR